MTLLVDTSVWSLAFRRDVPPEIPHVSFLIRTIESGLSLVSTGLILQEILQGFAGPKQRVAILSRFAALPLVQPTRDDHVGAADLRNACRRVGAQLATIDALLVQICITYGFTLLTTDKDFDSVPKGYRLKIWRP